MILSNVGTKQTIDIHYLGIYKLDKTNAVLDFYWTLLAWIYLRRFQRPNCELPFSMEDPNMTGIKPFKSEINDLIYIKSEKRETHMNNINQRHPP